MRTAALVATIALAVFAAQAAAFPKKPSCACALRGGDDACGCNRVLVRPPRPIKIDPQGPRVVCHRFPGVDPLHPIGDVCSCGHKFVTPADQQRPYCPHCNRHRHVLLPNGEFALASELAAAGDYERERERGAVYLPAEEPCVHYREADASPPPPVDPVSLSLAFGLAQRRGLAVREESLAFGPKQLPRDGQVRRTVPDVPEEGLLAFDKQVVELRLPTPYGCARAALEAEAQEALWEAQQAEIEAAAADEVTTAHGIPRLLTYGEAGYVPEHGRTPFFVRESGDLVREELAREGYFVPRDATTFAAEISVPRRPGSVIVASDAHLGYDHRAHDDDEDGSYGLDDDGTDDYEGEAAGSLSGEPGLLQRLVKAPCGKW